MGKPSFIIIGSERSGTTTLFDYISQHPQFCKPYQKEIEFFDKHYEKGVSWYEQQFNQGFTGEATPTYYWNPAAPKRVHDYNPDIKIIHISRNESEAVYSKYWQQVSKGVEKFSFDDAIKYEATRTEGELNRVLNLPYNYYPALYSEFAYRDRYSKRHMENWKKLFNVYEIDFRSLVDKPNETMKSLFAFLELEEFEIKPCHSNKGIDYPPMK